MSVLGFLKGSSPCWTTRGEEQLPWKAGSRWWPHSAQTGGSEVGAASPPLLLPGAGVG